MLRDQIPALHEHVQYYRVESWPGNNNWPFRFVRIWGKWDNCEDEKLMWAIDERDFRRLAILYLWSYLKQDIVLATWWRLRRRLHDARRHFSRAG